MDKLNKDQAIAAMKRGKKVRHKFFMEHEWITMDKDGNIVTEDGMTQVEYDFWNPSRNSSAWFWDWEIVKTLIK